MAKWNDVYLRDTLSDTGDYPSSGTMSSSPDIIPVGTTPIDNPDKYFLIDNWGKDLYKDLTARINNFIYVRASNLAGKDQTGSLYLYYAEARLLLYPNFWSQNIIKTGNGSDCFKFTVKKDGKIMSADAAQGSFVWVPEMITNDHYCLIGRVVTPDHPNAIPDVSSLSDFATFIAGNPNYAWRNVAVMDKNSPDYVATVKYDQGAAKEKIYFLLTCTSVPVGAEVAVSCATPGVNPALSIPRQKIVNPDSQIVGVYCDVPANWHTDSIQVQYWANGKKPTKGFDIHFDGLYIVPASNALFQHGLSLEKLGIAADFASANDPQKAVRVGGYHIHAE